MSEPVQVQTVSALPVCGVHHPTCGACGAETQYEDGFFYCEDCLLNYGGGEDGSQAEFLDTEAEVCAALCENYWHGLSRIHEGWGYECHPCPLPTEHASDHWHPCTTIDHNERKS